MRRRREVGGCGVGKGGVVDMVAVEGRDPG